jgi:glutathione S-transferase
VQLLESDIRTREVLSWAGVHVFHAHFSSCSQKLRMYLNCKRIDWISHPIDLGKTENLSPFYLGINPRGLVPCLVHDGTVHIESNDIILHLERAFPPPRLIPVGSETRIQELLQHEDELHLDMRTVTFRFLMPPAPRARMSPEALTRYANTGSGTVQGRKDAQIAREISFWEAFETTGISDEAARQSVQRLKSAFAAINRTLEKSAYIHGGALSVVDIAWFVYVHRLRISGYPLERLHASLNEWYLRLAQMTEIARELAPPEELDHAIKNRRSALSASGQTLELVCGL